jgi:hypothetical protein
MKFPKRAKQHISESSSFSLFNLVIPDNWILRELTEKDYGIDCYLEIVNDSNDITGEFTLVQLKSKLNGIPWTLNDYFTLTGVKISSTNYWKHIDVPVFIFVTDIKNKKVYFKSVDKEIRTNYQNYLAQGTFNYIVNKSDEFEPKKFKYKYYIERYRKQFENELVFFLSNLENNRDFQLDHNGRDQHLGIKDEVLIYFEAMHRNYSFLCMYVNILNEVPSLSKIKKRSERTFPNNHYDLYEHDLIPLMDIFEKQTEKIIKKLKKIIEKENQFWISTNLTLMNYIENLRTPYK